MPIKKGNPNPLNAKHYLSTHPIYRLWASVKNRCYNVNEPSYKDYGLRGVKMCDEWVKNPEVFIKWALENGWEKGMQIDKDIKGNRFLYSPDNCLFVTRKENCNNRRSSRYIEYNSMKKTLMQWSEILNIHPSTIGIRLKHGYTVEQALTSPIGTKLPGRRPLKHKKRSKIISI